MISSQQVFELRWAEFVPLEAGLEDILTWGKQEFQLENWIRKIPTIFAIYVDIDAVSMLFAARVRTSFGSSWADLWELLEASLEVLH